MNREELLLFGERIRLARNQAGLTQEQTADKIGITTRFYQMVERGEKGLALDKLMNLAKAINASTDYLLFGEPPAGIGNPISEIFDQLTQRQKADAVKLLRLYLDACLDGPKRSIDN